MTKLPRPLQAPSAHALRAISLGVLLAWAGAQTQAQTLSELVAQARGYDASWQAQQADARAAASRADQALSGLLPNVGLSAGANRTHVDIHTSVPVPGMTSSDPSRSARCSARRPARAR